MNLMINNVLEPITDSSPIECLARVLFIDKKNNVAKLIGLQDPPRSPFEVALNDLSSSLLAGDTKTVAMLTPEFLLVLEDSLTEIQKLDRDKKWSVIAPLIETYYPGQIFYPGQMGRMVSERASELGVQRKYIYRLLYRFWVHGQLKNAFLKNYINTGKSARTYVP